MANFSLYNYSEETLERIDNNLVQIEAMLALLECKLASIPAEPIPEPPPSQNPSQPAESSPSAAAEVKAANGEENKEGKSEDKKEENKGNDPEAEKESRRAELYADTQVKKFAKMLMFGIP